MTTDIRAALERAMRELELAADALDRSGYDASSKRARNEAYAARAALAAEPVGEVGELVAELELMANHAATACQFGDAKILSDAATLLQQQAAPAPVVVPVAIPGEQWHEDDGACLWWRFPIVEPPWAGDPRGDDWPGCHTHFTRIVCPLPQAGEVEA